jgi:hypothetical protein
MLRYAGRLLFVAALLGIGAGCSQQTKKGQLSGTVTFKGKLVPAGYISFMPDSSGKNPGAVKVAQIKDGVYDTAKEEDPGVSPGAVLIRIAGFDGQPLRLFPQGKQIFNPYEAHATVPEGTTIMDFTVPASAAQNLRIEPTSDAP